MVRCTHKHSALQHSVFIGRLRLKCDGTRAEARTRLSAKRASPFKSVGSSVQSTTGSRGVRISGSNAGYTMLRGSVKSNGHPLHSPVSPLLPLPCETVCHHISPGLCVLRRLLFINTWPSHFNLRYQCQGHRRSRESTTVLFVAWCLVSVLSVIDTEWHKNVFWRTEVYRSGWHSSQTVSCVCPLLLQILSLLSYSENCQAIRLLCLQHFWFLFLVQHHGVETCREEVIWFHALLIP